MLNEAFAYRYLVQQGYTSVAFVPEGLTKTPDLSFIQGTRRRFCEVKSIAISDEEISRTASGDSFDRSVYFELSSDLLDGKFRNILAKAFTQLAAAGEGLVYLVWNFDDFTLRHFEKYKAQLLSQLEAEYPSLEVYIKVGLQSRKRVHHVVRA